MNRDRDLAARELIAFYLDAGVDTLVGDVPVDRFAEDPPVPATAAVARKAAPTPDRLRRSDPPPTGEGKVFATAASAAPVAPEAAVMAAREAARSATSLAELRTILDRFEGCALRATATQLVFADGNPHARVMFVGEAPGRDEDVEGLPFVGRSGKLLDRMLAAIGLDRQSVLITNVIYWRPPGNRTPTTAEIASCLPFVLRHVALVMPKILVLCGGTAAGALLPQGQGITRLRGRWFDLEIPGLELPVPTLPMFHPSFLLRAPERKREAWRDLLALRARLDELLRRDEK